MDKIKNENSSAIIILICTWFLAPDKKSYPGTEQLIYKRIHSKEQETFTVKFTGYLDFLRLAWVGLAPVSVKKRHILLLGRIKEKWMMQSLAFGTTVKKCNVLHCFKVTYSVDRHLSLQPWFLVWLTSSWCRCPLQAPLPPPSLPGNCVCSVPWASLQLLWGGGGRF